MTPPDPDGHQPDAGPQHRPPVPNDRMLDKHQVAEIFGGGMTAKTVVRSWRRWGLTPIHVGKDLRWWESEVYAWLEKNRAAE